VHVPLLGLAAHRVREPGLAEAAGADDRGDPGGTQHGGHRAEVVVPAEQRVGLVRDAVPDSRRLVGQQLLV
jgi:hypothetical protein